MPSRARIINAMTVDVEDYYHVSAFDRVVHRDQWQALESRVCRNTDRLLEIFAEFGVRATFFVLGWVAERFPGLMKRIADEDHEVASHGFDHRLVYESTPEQFRQDVRRAKTILEAITGRPVLGYRAPSYSITRASLWALDVLLEEGYTYDASVYPIHHDRYGIPDASRHAHWIARPGGRIWEVPGSTVRYAGANFPIGGGGYFRFLPYRLLRWGIRRLNGKERRPAVFYVHPWEIDPGQPRLNAPLLTRMRHYHNLANTEDRLRRLLGEFAFGSLQQTVLHESLLRGASVRYASHGTRG